MVRGRDPIEVDIDIQRDHGSDPNRKFYCEGNLMGKLLLDSLSGFAGEAIKLLMLIITGVVLLDRVKNATSQLNTRVGALEQWRDEHISSIEPHTVCILENRRKVDEREWLERIERKIDRLEERIDALTEKIHG
jgi:hypothetical protein